MSQHVDIARAWKEGEYRRSLSDQALAQLPENPAGIVKLTDAELGAVEGGMPPSCDDCGNSYPWWQCSYAQPPFECP
jgi:mersacidin/lichenicidin family type 2 lantibiotic